MLAEGACAHFRTGSFGDSARSVRAIGDLPGIDGHPPNVDVRPGGVTVRRTTIAPADHGLSPRDVEPARRISAVAREPGVPVDGSAVQTVQCTVDALAVPEVMAFWRAVLGCSYRDDSPEDLVDPRGRGPSCWFQQMDAPRPQRNQVHLDVWVPADPEGNEVCLATPVGRD